jgi:hypothetical protein
MRASPKLSFFAPVMPAGIKDNRMSAGQGIGLALPTRCAPSDLTIHRRKAVAQYPRADAHNRRLRARRSDERLCFCTGGQQRGPLKARCMVPPIGSLCIYVPVPRCTPDSSSDSAYMRQWKWALKSSKPSSPFSNLRRFRVGRRHRSTRLLRALPGSNRQDAR